MLAASPAVHHDIPLREHSHLNLQQANLDAPPNTNYIMENRLCPGCRQSAVSEQGGLVVAFGQSFFHVDCFKCAKCGDQVTADTNLLLLSDGSPICANCSYNCNVCHQPILDEAIMTGDDSYHAHCFNCKVCKNRIDELVFAKTTQGIYCMNCHNERMAKIRKHAQKKAEREKAAGGSSSTKSRDRDARHHQLKETGRSSPPDEAGAIPSEFGGRSKSTAPPQDGSHTGRSRPSVSRGAENLASIRSPAKRTSGPYVSDAFEGNPQHASGSNFVIPSASSPRHSPSTPSFPPRPPSVTVAPPLDLDLVVTRANSPSANVPLVRPPVFSHPTINGTLPSPPPPEYSRLIPEKKNTLPIPTLPDDGLNNSMHKRSFDDGTRPLNVLFKQGSEISNFGLSEGLSAPTSRRDKRRSINPGLALTNFSLPVGPSTLSAGLSPISGTFASQQLSHSQTPPMTGRESPLTLSPLRSQFPESYNNPPQPSSLRNSSSSYHSAATSPTRLDDWSKSTGDTTLARSRSVSANPHQPDQSQTTTRPPLRPSLNSERVTALPKSHGLSSLEDDQSPGRLSPSLMINGNILNPLRSFDDRVHKSRDDARLSSASFVDVQRSRSTSRSRPDSRVDVPHSVESGTDTEPEPEPDNNNLESGDDIPPVPPPKEPKDIPVAPDTGSNNDTFTSQIDNREASPASETDPDTSRLSHLGSSSDDMLESSPVEHTSHSTFIAPALPPIRFSMNSGDFADLLSSVGGMPSLKSLDHLAKLTEEIENGPLTPPLSTESFISHVSSTNDATESSARDIFSQTNDDTMKISELAPQEDIATVEHSIDDSKSTSPPSGIITAPTPPASESYHQAPQEGSESADSNLQESKATQITLTEPGMNTARTLRHDNSEHVLNRLQEVMKNARERGAQHLKFDRAFAEAILTAMETRQAEYVELKGNFDGVKRASKQYIDGLTVAQTEYDRELKARRDAESEVTRLRVLLSGQAARLTTLSGDARRQELRQQLSKDLSDNLTGLEHDLSKLRVERDMTVAEVEELSASKESGDAANSDVPKLSRSLTSRLDKIKTQYQRELIPLTQQRETLTREIAELKAVRDVFLEETTVLNARNEELARLSTQYRSGPERAPSRHSETIQEKPSFDRPRPSQHQYTPQQLSQSLSSSTTTSSYASDDTIDSRYTDAQRRGDTPSRKFKWPGSKPKDLTPAIPSDSGVKSRAHLEHSFHQLSVMRFTRCDHCGDKMWGSQLRCSGCNISVHVRCIHNVQSSCQQGPIREEQLGPSPPSMFGRDLTEQVHADSKGGDRQVPLIVEKCIEAVEASAIDYEGIYRKTGGSGQSKAITQLFERGDYDAFDLRDSDRFNDISSVTSVLKTYFRSLPVPLMTFDLHDNFMSAVQIRDPALKNKTLLDLVNKLPNEHYYTLRMLMMHLHHVRERSETNLMNARNLGVVFGPTLMRSPDPSAEFSDMAGKALTVEWLVENASFVFSQNVSPN